MDNESQTGYLGAFGSGGGSSLAARVEAARQQTVQRTRTAPPAHSGQSSPPTTPPWPAGSIRWTIQTRPKSTPCTTCWRWRYAGSTGDRRSSRDYGSSTRESSLAPNQHANPVTTASTITAVPGPRHGQLGLGQLVGDERPPVGRYRKLAGRGREGRDRALPQKNVEHSNDHRPSHAQREPHRRSAVGQARQRDTKRRPHDHAGLERAPHDQGGGEHQARDQQHHRGHPCGGDLGGDQVDSAESAWPRGRARCHPHARRRAS